MNTHCSMAGEHEAQSRAKVTPNLAPRTILPQSRIPDTEAPVATTRSRGQGKHAIQALLCPANGGGRAEAC
jgi:hypothetical protein